MKLQRLLLLTTILAVSSQFVQAQGSTATTDPVGFVTTTIAASPNGTSFTTTPISPVLLQASGITGSTIGAISSLSSNSVTLPSAGWTDNQLASSSAYVLFKTGASEGLIVRITSNTADTAVVDTLGANLTQLGVVSGNQVQLVQGDTLLSMFGTPADGVVGGTAAQFSANQTDRVNVRDATGIVRTFYFNTDVSEWRRSGTGANQGSVPISPLSGAFYLRIGQTPITQVTTGNVPTTGVKYLVPTSGLTYFARFFPASGTINDFGFQNLPGWSLTDRVNTTDASGVVRSYFWNGTEWRRSGTSANQSSTPVPIGGAVSVSRSGSVGPAQLLSVNIPYNLASQ
jgi:hypothetical protein